MSLVLDKSGSDVRVHDKLNKFDYTITRDKMIVANHEKVTRVKLTPQCIELLAYDPPVDGYRHLGSLTPSGFKGGVIDALDCQSKTVKSITDENNVYEFFIHPDHVIYNDYILEIQEKWTFDQCEIIDVENDFISRVSLNGRVALNRTSLF